jgi:hypothetical protein
MNDNTENTGNFWDNIADKNVPFEPTDEQQALLDVIYAQPYEQRYFLAESYDKSFREMASEFDGINQKLTPEFWAYHEKYGIKHKPNEEQVRYMNADELNVFNRIDWKRRKKKELEEPYMTPVDKIKILVQAIKQVHRTEPRTEEEWKEGKKAIGKYKKEIERLERVIDKNNTYKQTTADFESKSEMEEGMKYYMTSTQDINPSWVETKDFENSIETDLLDSYRPFTFNEDNKSKSYIIVSRNGRKVSFEDLKNEISEATFTKAGNLRRKLREFEKIDKKNR